MRVDHNHIIAGLLTNTLDVGWSQYLAQLLVRITHGLRFDVNTLLFISLREQLKILPLHCVFQEPTKTLFALSQRYGSKGFFYQESLILCLPVNKPTTVKFLYDSKSL